MNLPFLLLDVDGPLNPWAAPSHRRPGGYVTHRMRPTGWTNPHKKALRVLLNPAHGPALVALPYQIVWCSTWKDEANTWIGPHLGLPTLEHIPFPDPPSRPDARLHWKTSHIVHWAQGRPFVWVDDEASRHDDEYIKDTHHGFGRILRIAPSTGLRDDDFATLTEWAHEAAQVSSGYRHTHDGSAEHPLKQRGS